MSARRDWTEAQARAWLKASLPKGWRVLVWPVTRGAFAYRTHDGWTLTLSKPHTVPTLRAACLALVRAAKRAGIRITAAPEPQGGAK